MVPGEKRGRVAADDLGGAARGLSCPVRNHSIIARAEQAFPAADGEGEDVLQFVVVRSMCPIHQACNQAKAAGVVGGSAQAGLHKWPRDGIHFSKAGIGESLLSGECVCCE